MKEGKMPDAGSYVLDASAVLALLNDEPGSEPVIAALNSEGTVICSVNYSEVIGKLASTGMDEIVIREAVGTLALKVVVFDEVLAERTGFLYPKTSSSGLSLGDRACLSLSMETGMPALTTDKAWSSLRIKPRAKVIR